jgi:hypothetical protein
LHPFRPYRIGVLTNLEQMFDPGCMLDVAIRKADGTLAVDLGGRAGKPPLPVPEALRPLLPEGLRRGATVAVHGSLSLLLALLGDASAAGAWCALVGFPRISAEAAREYGIDLARLAIVPARGPQWTTAVGALLDAVDVVAARPPARVLPGDVRRLAARARTRDAVLMPYTAQWPGADVRVQVAGGSWSGIGDGTGRLRARLVEVQADGRGASARPRRARLWLPAAGGGVLATRPAAEVIELAG